MSVSKGRNRRRLQVGALIAALAAAVALPLAAMGPPIVTGTVFHDIAGDVLNDGPVGSSTNPGLAGIAVHVFADSGTDAAQTDALDPQVSVVTTDVNGAFSVETLADGAYWVAVDSRSLPHPQAWAQQTWGPGAVAATAAVAANGPRYGGADPGVSDALSIINTVDRAQHVAYIRIIGGQAVDDVQFGFSFNVVTNTLAGDARDDDLAVGGRTVQGSLRQFLDNAREVPGSNAMRFVPAVATNAAGVGGAWWQVVVSEALPFVATAGTTLDGTAYSALDGVSILEPNPGTLGAGAAAMAVGADEVPLPAVARPELELVAAGTVPIGIDVRAPDADLSGIAVRGFSDYGVRLQDTDRLSMEQMVIGTSPDAISDPGPGNRNDWGIEIDGGVGGVISATIVVFSESSGINAVGTNAGWTVSGNEVGPNGLLFDWTDQIRLNAGTGIRVEANYVYDGSANGVEIRAATQDATVVNNTVTGSGVSGTELAGIRDISTAGGHSLEANVLSGNVGPGIVVTSTAPAATAPSGTTITRNLYGGNGAMAVDLVVDAADIRAGDGPNSPTGPDTCGYDPGALTANRGIDAPNISLVGAPGPYLRIVGSACPGGTVEIYRAVADGDGSDTFTGVDYGEGVEYLGSTVAATDGTFDVIFDVATPPTIAVSATVTDALGNTSEFSANQQAVEVNIPVVTVLGPDPATAEAGNGYVDAGATASDIEDGDLTSSIVVSGGVDVGSLGTYQVLYDVTDSDGYPAITQARSVQVVDTVAPVLSLTGGTPVQAEAGVPFVDPGAIALDSFEGDLTGSVVVSGSVDTSSLGMYVLTYEVSDSSGNAAVPVTRVVTVADTAPPLITLVGDDPLMIDQGDTFTDPGATANDAFDGDLTPSIVVSGSVDTFVVGIHQITYDVADSSGNAAVTVVRDVEVVAIPNDAPVARADTFNVLQRQSVSVAAPGVLANDSDPDGHPLAATLLVGGKYGTVVLAGDGSFTYSRSVTGTQTDSFTYRVEDPFGLAAIATVTITVTPINRAPTVADDQLTVNEDGMGTVSPLANDLDLDGDVLSLAWFDQPATGSLFEQEGSTLVFEPAPDWHGTLSVAYGVTDGKASAAGTITITVVPINDAPVAVADSVTTDGSVVIDVLVNDRDVDGDVLTLASVGSAGEGTVQLDSSAVIYTPREGFSGQDSFSYSITDGQGGTATAVVAVSVEAVEVVAVLSTPPPGWDPPTSTSGSVGGGDDSPGVPFGPFLVSPQLKLAIDAFFHSLSALQIPLVLVGVAILWMLIFGSAGVLGAASRNWAVVRVSREATLPVYERPGERGAVIHLYGPVARRIRSVGRPKRIAGSTWLPVETPEGRGWADAAYLTEDLARSSVEAELDPDAFVASLVAATQALDIRSVLSPRGVLAWDSLSRGTDRQLVPADLLDVFAEIAEHADRIVIDEPLAPGIIRPTELRNFHFLTLGVAGKAAWEVTLEYHRAKPYVVALRIESARVRV